MASSSVTRRRSGALRCAGLLAAGLSLLLAGAVPIRGQGTPSGTGAARPGPEARPDTAARPGTAHAYGPPLLTLAVWADDVWLDVLDRQGTYHGRLAEQGIFQRFHPDMDHEYALDVLTGMFGPGEDGGWAAQQSGLRAAAASVSHPHILNRLDWREAYPVSEGLHLTADYTRDHSLTDRRDYARLGLRWSPARTAGWSVRARVGLHFFKPEADVEVAAERSWGGDGAAAPRWRAGVALAAVDAFSDVVFVSLGVDPDEVEAHLDHDGLPLAGRVVLEGRGRRWRAELHAGATTTRRARVTFAAAGVGDFDLEERVAFTGAVVEGRPVTGLSIAGHARVAVARTERGAAGARAPALRLRERTEGLGAMVRWALGDVVAAEGEVRGVWRPEERSEGGVGREHADRAVFGSLGLVRHALRGWTGRVAYTTLDRRPGVLLPGVGGRNARLVTEAGYRTRAGFRVVAGLRWDLDGGGEPPFDGAHLRLAAPGR